MRRSNFIWPLAAYEGRFAGGETIRLGIGVVKGRPFDFERARRGVALIIGNERGRAAVRADASDPARRYLIGKRVGETRQFRMHPKLLFDVINRQAGTLTKAVAEGVMNAIDAGASEVKVQLSQETVIIADDGKGFRSRQEIESFFETFGEPHREGDAVYGTFRMGRGQIFSFGVNRWASGNFEMLVDDRHVHGPEFYETFHNMADDLLPSFMAYVSESLPRVMEQHARRYDKAMLRALDHKARIQKVAAKVEAIPERLPVAAKRPVKKPVNPSPKRGFGF